jgi:hypothetical protein
MLRRSAGWSEESRLAGELEMPVFADLDEGAPPCLHAVENALHATLGTSEQRPASGVLPGPLRRLGMNGAVWMPAARPDTIQDLESNLKAFRGGRCLPTLP